MNFASFGTPAHTSWDQNLPEDHGTGLGLKPRISSQKFSLQAPLASSRLVMPPIKQRKEPKSSNEKRELDAQFSHLKPREPAVNKILSGLLPDDFVSKGTSSSSGDISAKLNNQQILLEDQPTLLSPQQFVPVLQDLDAVTASLSSPAKTKPNTTTPPYSFQTNNIDEGRLPEMQRLKKQLDAANSRIASQEAELAQTHVMKHTVDQAMGPSSVTDPCNYTLLEKITDNPHNAFRTSQSSDVTPDSWISLEDTCSDVSNPVPLDSFNQNDCVWNGSFRYSLGLGVSGNKNCTDNVLSTGYSLTATDFGHNWNCPTDIQEFIPRPVYMPSNRILPGPGSPSYGFNNCLTDDLPRYEYDSYDCCFPRLKREGPCFTPQASPWATFSSATPLNVLGGTNKPLPPYHGISINTTGSPYQTETIGTSLSPTAPEFTSASTSSGVWDMTPRTGTVHTHASILEPLNYRRLLDKSVSCDWKYIVDKIVCGNDQQASIFLQQKLKVGTSEQKYEIVEAIFNQAYPLMVNRFGNFLVQRCFEHGTQDQIVSIANAIRGNTLSLSMDPFGCHVIQKAFDCVSEEHKAMMVHELLRRIPETIIHRYACHVWQKLFELRWSNEPPQIMAKVNEALRGMWHDVALGETGSLVVQNIFENCVEDEKRQAIEEVLAKIDLLVHGQFGNWCIQHICEHGAPHDRSRAIEHILLRATEYSVDQFSSKVVEKCLKIGGPDFLDRYLCRVCSGRPDRPRMPLVDISGDQYGNYLVQWILINGNNRQKELVTTHVRKHMVSLRGSKFGSRVAMLCCGPNHTARSGPGGLHTGRLASPAYHDRFSISQSMGRSNQSGNNNHWNTSYHSFR